MDEIGNDKVAVFSIGCMSPLNLANPPGMVFIPHIDDEKETILFRNPVYVDTIKTYWTTYMRFDFINVCWNIIQMRYPFKRMKMLERINTLYI